MTTKFWDDLLSQDTLAIRQEFDDLWVKAGAGAITPEQAERTLDLLFKVSHLRIAENASLRANYPTEQGGPFNKLASVEHLWWVDHATAGINGNGTLDWFSSKRRTLVRKFKTEAEARAHYGAAKPDAKVYQKEGAWYVQWIGYAGAVTHFVSFFDGTPFYILKIAHCCWGEPRRNADAIHIELVNPLVCRLKDGVWHFWAGPISQKLLDGGLVPVSLDKPFRGAKYMMPYTWSQVITNIKLKRLCVMATGRMSPERMSQHTDWRESKFDMGPLWPHKVINDAAFEMMPVEEYDFMKAFVVPSTMDDIVDKSELAAIEAGIYDVYDMDNDTPADVVDLDSTRKVQEVLIKLYGDDILPKYGADGDLGPETCKAVRHFQWNWNRHKPSDAIRVDGIPGTVTCDRLAEALALGAKFNVHAPI